MAGPRAKDEAGNRYGLWTVLCRNGSTKNGAARWLCRCDCGTESNVPGVVLRKGISTNCGCIWRTKIAVKSRMRSLPPGRAAFNYVYRYYKAGAKQRGLEWSLSEDQADSVFRQNCTYCGGSPRSPDLAVLRGLNGKYHYNGIDRVDSSEGYVIGNVVACCSDCNRAKWTKSVEDFSGYIDRVYEYQNSWTPDPRFLRGKTHRTQPESPAVG